jgi:hypothetical protein
LFIEDWHTGIVENTINSAKTTHKEMNLSKKNVRRNNKRWSSTARRNGENKI